ncbi:sensor histidine kinase [Gordonia insulae]|uniref:Sensor histidine kinase DesK n=1 Tax=Gordonia insulae TaxID=2420509 RepID=A0A3G8JSL1_9ACTN|nr:histidine kinase [Gordonia insulae]AZG47715.1 Sensor histidine kinase DesK [Gordonia insulae]
MTAVTAVTGWWHGLSGPERFRLYTRLTLQSAILGVAVILAVTTARPWAAPGVLIAGAAALLAVEAQPEFTTLGRGRPRRWMLPTAAAVLVAVWVAYAIAARVMSAAADVDAARSAGIYVAMLAALSIVPFVRHRWWIALAISVATGAAFAAGPRGMLQVAGITFAVAVFLVGTTLLTRWALIVVDDLERARVVEAKLQVAEERLRFSRDLHDVVGRGFSAIAVKSELASTLLRAGAADRAGTEVEEIKTLAVESMEQMRALVHGYRDINLDGEVAGARSLLSAAGCELRIEGDPSAVPAEFHEVAAWVVREATTNIVKHSSATSATFTMGSSGMTLRNNGVSSMTADSRDTVADERSGLRGLAERLAEVGARLERSCTADEFVLEVKWENA